MINETPSFQFFKTADGSPTLALGSTEKMHSEAGAFSETVAIYGRVVDFMSQRNLPPRFLSVGLGLGYVEMMIAAKIFSPDLHIESFEKEIFLRERLTEWLGEKPPGHEFSEEFNEAYGEILARTARTFHLSPVDLKNRLKVLWTSGRWKIHGALDEVQQQRPQAFSVMEPFTAVLFDAFSNRTSPELWSEDFLSRFLKRFTDGPCVFSTYACTGALKRALKGQGFQLLESPGFGMKRQSTWAVRETSIP